MPPRKSLKKWVDRTFETRKGRITAAGKYRRAERMLSESNLSHVFRTSEEILEFGKTNNGTLLFIGQGMRPIFETVRAINEQDKAISRSRLKYVVTPKSIGYTGGQNKKHFEREVKAQTEIVKRELGRRNIVTKKQNTYLVVDASFAGDTKRFLQSAIRSINPDAEVIWMEGKSWGEGILVADEHIDRPTKKDRHNARLMPGEESERNLYLAFQQKMQEYLKSRKK